MIEAEGPERSRRTELYPPPSSASMSGASVRSPSILSVILPTTLLSYHVMLGGTFLGSLVGIIKISNQILFGVFFLILLIAFMQNRLRLHAPALPIVVLGFGIAWEGIASTMGPYPRLSQEVWLTRVWYLSAAYASFVWASNPERRRVLCLAVLFASIAPLVLATSQFAHWMNRPDAGARIESQRSIVATLNHSNDFASYLALLIPLAMASMFHPKASRWSMPGWLAYCGVLCFFLGMTLSRSGWLGCIVAIGIVIAGLIGGDPARRKSHAIRVALFTSVAFASFRIPGFLTQQDWMKQRLSGSLRGDYGIRQRIVFWKTMSRIIRDRPLTGWGDGMTALVYPQYLAAGSSNELPFHGHNIFIQWAVEGGVPAALLQAVGICWILIAGVRAISGARDEDKVVLLSMIAATVGYFVCSLFQCNLATPAIHVVAMLFLGAIARAVTPSQIQVQSKIQRQAILCFSLLAGFAYVLAVIPRGRAHIAFDDGITALNRKRKDAVRYLQTATHLDPDNVAYRSALAIALRRLNDDRDMAMDECSRAIAIFSRDPVLHHNRGWLLMESRQIRQAMEEFKMALKLDSSRQAYWYDWAIVEERFGYKISDAQESWHLATQFQPPDPRSFWLYSEFLARNGKPSEARANLKLAIESIDPRKTEGLHVPTRYYRIYPEDESLDPLPSLPPRAVLEKRLLTLSSR